MPVDFVTWVLNTPWMLISAPETKAIKKPIIGFYHLFFLVVVYPSDRFVHSYFIVTVLILCTTYLLRHMVSSSCCTRVVTSSPFHTLENSTSSCIQKFPVSSRCWFHLSEGMD